MPLDILLKQTIHVPTPATIAPAPIHVANVPVVAKAANPPEINAGIATIVNQIAVIVLLSLATPPIVNHIPIKIVKPRIQTNTGKHPLGSA